MKLFHRHTVALPEANSEVGGWLTSRRRLWLRLRRHDVNRWRRNVHRDQAIRWSISSWIGATFPLTISRRGYALTVWLCVWHQHGGLTSKQAPKWKLLQSDVAWLNIILCLYTSYTDLPKLVAAAVRALRRRSEMPKAQAKQKSMGAKQTAQSTAGNTGALCVCAYEWLLAGCVRRNLKESLHENTCLYVFPYIICMWMRLCVKDISARIDGHMIVCMFLIIWMQHRYALDVDLETASAISKIENWNM